MWGRPPSAVRRAQPGKSTTRLGPVLSLGASRPPADRHEQQTGQQKRCQPHDRIARGSRSRKCRPSPLRRRALPQHRSHETDHISAIPAPSLSRFGFPSPSQRTSGGQKIRASLTASRQASTPERNIPAIATRRFFSGVMERTLVNGSCGDTLCGPACHPSIRYILS